MAIPVRGSTSNKPATVAPKPAIRESSAPANVSAKVSSVSATELHDVIVNGDLSKLSKPMKLQYYEHVCKGLGLNAATKPLEFVKFPTGKMALYLLKEGAAQLSRIHDVTHEITDIKHMPELAILFVRVRSSLPSGRFVDEVAAVPFGANLKGEAAANAYMKVVTKVKRRGTLSLCGMGLLDETELETVPGTKKIGIDGDSSMVLKAPKKTLKAKPEPVEDPEPEVIEPEVVEPPKPTENKSKKPETTKVMGVEVDKTKVDRTERSTEKFLYEDKEQRQRLIREIKNRFPTLKRSDLAKLGPKYKFSTTWEPIIDDLDRMKANGKVDLKEEPLK